MIDLSSPVREFGERIEVVGDCTGIMGFRGTALSHKGKLQEYKDYDDLETVGLVDFAVDHGLVVGTDNRVYGRRFGLIDCMTPIEPTGKGGVYVLGIDWASLPPKRELAWLYDNFFSKYDREVLMLMGVGRNGKGWLYHVPEQVGSPGFVKWEAGDDEMGEFQERARWVGTIHVHPGTDSSPSQMDADDWSNPEKSGLHIIFGRDGDYTVCGAIAGHTFSIYSRTVVNVDRAPTPYTTSRGRGLVELLKEPEPICLPITTEAETQAHWEGADSGERVPVADATDLPEWEEEYVTGVLKGAGTLPVELRDLASLRLIKSGSQYWIATLDQWLEVHNECKDVCPVPIHRKLKTRVGRRGE